MGIRGRLLLGYALVIVILIAAGALIVRRMGGEMEAAVRRNALTVASSLIDEADRATRERVQSIRFLTGTSDTLQAALVASNQAFEARGPEAQVHAEIDVQDAAWRAADAETPTPFMRKLLDNEISAELRRTMEYLSRAEGRPVFAEIFVTNRFGANAGQTGRTSDYRQDDEDWWQAAWQKGTWVSREIGFDESAGVHALDIALRIDDETGAPLGVVKAVLHIAALRDIIDGFAAVSRLDGAYVELVDHEGHLIHRQGEPRAFGDDLSGEEAVRRVRAGEQGSCVETTPRGNVLRTHVRSRASTGAPDLGWALLLNQPAERAFQNVRRLERWMLFVGICAAVLAFFVGVLFAQAFARITRRLESTAAALQRGEAQTRAIVTSVADGILSIDAEGRIEASNPAALALFGYTEEELLGHNVALLMPEPDRSRHDGYIQAYLETGEAKAIGRERRVMGRRKDGTEFPIDLRVGAMRGPGEPRFVGVLRDATEREAARRALEKAKDAAEAASTSKGRFLANMSHELRTPLNAIIGYSEMVGEELQERGEAALVADLEKVRSSGRHLLDLINDILDVSKIEAGRMEVHLESVELRPFVDGIAGTVRPLVAANQNRLVVEASDDLGTVRTDVTKLRQVLFNLLSNAAKFTRDGTVTLGVERDASGWVTVRVRDTGIGMSPEQLERVWDAFAQADASTTRQFGGTGLGLTISRSFCEMLGGTIDVTSRPGEGTTFTARLPVLAPEAEAETLVASAATTPAGRATDTVLVIDDDPTARDLVSRFLAKDGIEVIGASNGPDGLRLASEREPSVIVLDVMMPGMDGWAVLAALKEDPALAPIPVVMLTMVDEKKLGFALGVDGYLVKPVDRERLRGALLPFRLDPRGHQVLVVDDEADARELVARPLRGRGWTVREARDGREALDVLEANPIDVVLTDLMMPGVDGFELVDVLRHDPRWEDLPIVVLTSKEVTADEAARLEGSVERLLAKGSYSREALLDEVGRLVRTALLRRRMDAGREGEAEDGPDPE